MSFDFINIDARAIYDEILQRLESEVGEPLFPGDERRIFGEALTAVIVSVYHRVNDAAKQRLLRYARGEVLDALGESVRPRVERLQAQPAHTILRFSASQIQANDIIIPAGTRVTPNAIHYFATDQTVKLPEGLEYVDVPATSVIGGTEHNGFTEGTITVIVDVIPFIRSVTNTTISAGGDDGEPYTLIGDDHFRERIRLAPAGLSTAGSENSYRFWVQTADPRIGDVGISSPHPCDVLIVPLMADGSLPDASVLQKVEDTLSAEDVRPLTDRVFVRAPLPKTYDVELKYYAPRAMEAEIIRNVEGHGGSIERYLQWQDTALGRNINPDQLRKHILSPTDFDGNRLLGAIRVDVIEPQHVAVATDEVARFSGNLTVSHEVV